MRNTTYIVSDLHIGSRYFKRPLFLDFLNHLPSGSRLILNGDTIDNPHQDLSPEDLTVVDKISEFSQQAEVVWVDGNHDAKFQPQNAAAIVFAEHYELPDKRLYISHGSYFDNIMPYHLWFIRLFKVLHNIRLKIGASPVHVAEYAKRWGPLYRYLHNTVMRNAVEYARENNFQAVACGHVHQPEHTMIDNIEYINTGAWTELPTCYALLEDNLIRLMEWRGKEQPPVLLRDQPRVKQRRQPDRL